MAKEIKFTEDQRACIRTLADWAGGEHHLFEVKPFGPGVVATHYGSLSTFDFSEMTRLVLLAHRDAVRVEIQPGRYLKVVAHKRKAGGENELRSYERHPTLQDLIEMAETCKKE